AVGQEEHAGLQGQCLTVIKPISHGEASTRPFIIIDMSAEKCRRSWSAQDSHRTNRSGGYQRRHVAVLDPPQQIFSTDVETVGVAAGIAANAIASAAITRR